MGNRRAKVETVAGFIFLGSKIIVYGDDSHEIKRSLLLGRKAMTHLDSKFKSRDVTLLIKYSQKYSRQSIVKAMVFPAVMYGWLDRKEG